MESIANFYNNNPYMPFLSFLIGIAGVIFTIVTFWIGKKFKRLTYTKKPNTIVSLNNVGVDSLRLFYNNEMISDVSITRIAVWNSGKETIEKENIVPRRPLKVCVKDGAADNTRILNCSVDFLTDQNIFEDKKPSDLDLEKNNYEISFDFIDPNHGLIIQVIHTGDPKDIYLDCKIKGGKDLERVNNSGIKISKINKEVFGKTITINMFKVIYWALIALSCVVVFIYVYYAMNYSNSINPLFLILPVYSPIFTALLFRLFWGTGIPKIIQEKL